MSSGTGATWLSVAHPASGSTSYEAGAPFYAPQKKFWLGAGAGSTMIFGTGTERETDWGERPGKVALVAVPRFELGTRGL